MLTKNAVVTLRENVIEQIEQFLLREYLSISNVCFFMQSIRILNEIDCEKESQYKITKHYCDWLVHKELNRQSSKVVIEEIAEAFHTFQSKQDLVKKINNAISLQKLVGEIKEILWTKIPNKIVVSKMDYEEYWINFLSVLLHQLLLRPLKIKEHINIRIDDFDFTVYGLQVISQNEKYCIEILSENLEKRNNRLTIEIALFHFKDE